MPAEVLTVMSTVPAASAGDVAVQEMVDVHETAVPAVEPNLAVVEPTTKPVPVIVTTVLPTIGPATGRMAVITGPPKLNLSAAEVAEVPPEVVTVTSTVPATSAGEVAVQLVVVHETAVPAVPPKLTVVEPTKKPVPVMVTTVPPPSAPAPGEMAVMAGMAL